MSDDRICPLVVLEPLRMNRIHMRVCLVVENGKTKGNQIEIPMNGEVVVGRNPSTGIKVPDVMVSRQHFSISLDESGCIIRDLFSQNGTFVNEVRLEKEIPLRIGDMIHAGETTFSLLEMESKGLVGKEIAGYRLLERVGRGGMGTVFRANQLSLGREVAFKVLAARLIEDETFVNLFFKEARAAGALNHPNIVQVYDVGHSQGIYYYSMEFMPRGSVQDRLNQEAKIPWTEATKMVRDAAKGLQYAQRKNVVHRDIKPDNLMMAEDNTVKIADLGLAHKIDDSAVGDGEGILGTPHFISPEQAQGKPVDVRSDLYSLGATFFRMITGKNPFPGKNVREIILAQIQDPPTPVHELDSSIPREISAIVHRLMEKDPEDRYQSPGELNEDLERIWGNGNGAVGSPDWTRRISIATGVMAILIVIMLYLFKSGGENGNNNQQNHGGQSPVVEASGPTSTGPVNSAKTPDPAALKRAREIEAKLAFLEVKSDRTLEEEKRLEGFRAVAKAHPDTEFGKKALREADLIAGKIQARKDEILKRRLAVEKSWAEVKSKVDMLEKELRLAEADGAVQHFIQNHPKVDGISYKAEAQKLQNGIRNLARRMYLTLKADAESLAKEDQYDEAVATFEKFILHVAGGESPDSIFSGLVKRAKNLTDTFKKGKAALIARRFTADRLTLIEGYRKSHALALKYRFAEGLKVLTDARGKVQSKSYRKRFEDGIATLTAMRDLKAAFIERANRRKGIKNMKFPLASQRLGQETGMLKKADDVHVQLLVNFRGKKITAKFKWSDYHPGKFLQFFTENRWEMTSEEHKAIAYLAAELGRYPLAREYAKRSRDPILMNWVDREIEASKLYVEAMDGLGGESGESWIKVIDAVETLRQEYTDTLFYLYHTSGTTPLASEKAR